MNSCSKMWKLNVGLRLRLENFIRDGYEDREGPCAECINNDEPPWVDLGVMEYVLGIAKVFSQILHPMLRIFNQ